VPVRAIYTLAGDGEVVLDWKIRPPPDVLAGEPHTRMVTVPARAWYAVHEPVGSDRPGSRTASVAAVEVRIT
jgi:hypothetical protein